MFKPLKEIDFDQSFTSLRPRKVLNFIFQLNEGKIKEKTLERRDNSMGKLPPINLKL